MILNHLWQSTLCTAVAWLLTLALGKNPASVRYRIWLAASVKFLIPFSLLVSAGNQFQWRAAPSVTPSQLTFVMDQVSQPFASPVSPPSLPIPSTAPNFAPILLAVWLCGIAMGVFVWMRSWLRIRAALRTARPLHLPLPIPVMSSATRLEPGVFGIFKSVLLLPEGIADHLSPPQLEAILAHELCHVRRRDNLAAAIHMVVETIFWFHPLVWWIGQRLVDERERACDEEVLQLGSTPQVYAESILKVCKFYLESPLHCVSGITGSDLRKRIRNIMTQPVSMHLNAGRKVLLAVAGVVAVAAPVVVGVLNAPRMRAQSSEALAFEVASVKLNKSGSPREPSVILPGGRFTATNNTVRALILNAYGIFGSTYRLSGGPGWIDSERYDVEAKAEAGAIPTGAPARVLWEKTRLMLRTLLADRFQLSIRRETREMPVYELVVAKNGPKLSKSAQDCDASYTACHGFSGSPRQLTGTGVDMNDVSVVLSNYSDRPVLDKTGIQGVFDVKLQWNPFVGRPQPVGDMQPSPAVEAREGRRPDLDSLPTMAEALEQQLGLKLVSEKRPVEVYVIDHIERPSGNDQAFVKPQAFEVASVKPSDPNAGDANGFKSADQKPRGRDFQVEHGRFNATSANLFALIVKAYGVMGCRPLGGGDCALISGGPGWLKKDGFDVVAKMPDGSPDYTLMQFQSGRTPQLALMLQALLADRFQLKVHREQKQLPVFALTIGKKGPKFKKAEESEESQVIFRPSVQPNGQEMIKLVVKNSSIQDVADLYSKFMDRPVIDRTGLQGKYNFTMEYEADTDAPGPFARLSGPALFKAFEAQAGLKLEATKAPVEVLVIDHAEKPSAN